MKLFSRSGVIYIAGNNTKARNMKKIIFIVIAFVYLVGCGISYM